MKESISKFTFPLVLIAISLLLLYVGNSSDQNSLFMLASGAILLAGMVTLLNALGIINKAIKIAVLALLVLGSMGLGWLDYKSIKDPVDFLKEKEKRYKYVIQGLKDIREAEFAYKAAKNVYCNNFDSLVNFLRTDSLRVVKAFGTVPDTLTEEKAVELGIVQRDTVYVMAMDTVFNKVYLANHYGDFNIDSLAYVPFTSSKFDLQAGTIKRNGVEVQVFQAMDAAPFDSKDVLQVGSMSDPSTSGNWE